MLKNRIKNAIRTYYAIRGFLVDREDEALEGLDPQQRAVLLGVRDVYDRGGWSLTEASPTTVQRCRRLGIDPEAFEILRNDPIAGTSGDRALALFEMGPITEEEVAVGALFGATLRPGAPFMDVFQNCTDKLFRVLFLRRNERAQTTD